MSIFKRVREAIYTIKKGAQASPSLCHHSEAAPGRILALFIGNCHKFGVTGTVIRFFSSQMPWGGFGSHLPHSQRSFAGAHWGLTGHKTPPAPTQHQENIIAIISPFSSLQRKGILEITPISPKCQGINTIFPLIWVNTEVLTGAT